MMETNKNSQTASPKKKASVKKAAPKKKAAVKLPTNKPAAAKKATHLVTVKRDGFRRCNRAWSGETKIFAGDLTPKELTALKADPMFVVEQL